jgi:hypothetical protein
MSLGKKTPNGSFTPVRAEDEIPMTATFLALLLAGALPGDSKPETERKQSGIAPSLHELTDEEEEALDQTVNRFIDSDIGKLRGDEAKKAKKEFEKLGMDAVPALIRGLNRAAKIEGSCPAVLIAEKLSKLLGASQDPELLEFAHENIGLEVGNSRHAGTLQKLRVGCTLRKGELARRGITAGTPVKEPSGEKSLRSLSLSELAEAAGKERGPQLKKVLSELSQRKGSEAVSVLGTAVASAYDSDLRKTARELLDRNLARQTPEIVKESFKDERAEVRAAAARTVGEKGLKFGKELIDLLGDDDVGVRAAAHQGLVKLNRGKDLGPDATATEAERKEAIARWREWWSNQDSR